MSTYEQIVDVITDQFRAKLLEALPEINEAVKIGEGAGSATATLEVARKGKKDNRFRASLKFRVRAPREPVEFDMHLAEDGQLTLGLDPKAAAPPEPKGDDEPPKTNGRSSAASGQSAAAPA